MRVFYFWEKYDYFLINFVKKFKIKKIFTFINKMFIIDIIFFIFNNEVFMIKGSKLNRILYFSLVLGASFLCGYNASAFVKGSSSFFVNQMIGVPHLNSMVSVSPQFLAKTLELTIANDTAKNSNVSVQGDIFNNKAKREVKVFELRTKAKKVLSEFETKK